MATDRPAEPEECANCGRPGDGDLAAVQRVWVLPEASVDPDVERWCASCRSQYPHQEVDDS